MVMGVEGHTWRPSDMEDRQVAGIVQSCDAATLDWPDRLLQSATIDDELVENVADGQGRRVLGQC
jgi:hypothetical protein